MPIMNEPDISAIERRLKEIGELMDTLEREADELQIAIKIFNKFRKRTPEAEASTQPVGNDAPETPQKLGPPRPNNIPTNFQMTEMVIRNAEQQGLKGLTGVEIVEKIGELYWPGLTRPQILPMVYQFAKQGRLRKTPEGLFQTIRKIEASDVEPEGAPSEASHDSPRSPGAAGAVEPVPGGWSMIII